MENTLIKKLKGINKPKLEGVRYGHANTIKDFWEYFIEPHLPDKKIVIEWHKTLMEYVELDEAMFAIRGYHTKQGGSDDLRRGFLSKTTEGYSFFYTDNFHAAYYLKMVLDGYVTSVEEMKEAYNSRSFPSRFQRFAREEKELCGIAPGADPGFSEANYKIAHIINVGKDYFVDDKNVSFSTILEDNFDKGKRSDWKEVTDETGTYYLRNNFQVKKEAREYIVAHFLRFVHPFNYFLTPNSQKCIESSLGKDIAEYAPLIDFVREKYKKMYGDAYYEYLDKIMVAKEVKEDSSDTSSSGDETIDLTYCYMLNEIKKAGATDFNEKTILKMIRAYLNSQSLSYKKLENEYMKLNSKDGHFARNLCSSYGIIGKQHKGILLKKSLEEAIREATGTYKETLEAIQKLEG